MAEKIKIHPGRRAAPLFRAQHFAIKHTRGLQICHINRKVKGREHGRFPKLMNRSGAAGNKLPSPCAMIGLFSRINQFAEHNFILLAHDRCTTDPIMRVS